MARKLKSDKVLFLAVLFLVCVSAVMVCSASAAAALQRNWDVTRFLFKQTTWVVVGFLLMGVTMRIHYRGVSAAVRHLVGARHRRRVAACSSC